MYEVNRKICLLVMWLHADISTFGVYLQGGVHSSLTFLQHW